jgi:hypothetical protein
VEAALKGDLAAVKSELKGDLAELGTKISVVEAKLGMIQWLIGRIGFGVLLLVIKSFWPLLETATK